MRIAIAIGCLLVSSRAFAGAYMEMASKHLDDPSRGEKLNNKLWAQSGNARIESNGGVIIFKSGTVYVVNGEKKKYMVVDKAAMERMSGQMEAARAQAAEAMKNMPPEQRAQMEKAMAAQGMPTGQKLERTLKQTSKTETYNGRPCTVWEASEGGQKKQELCVVPMSGVQGGQEVVDTFKTIGKMFENMPGSSGAASADAFRDLEKLGGVPVITRDFQDGKAVREHRIVTSRSETVPASSFEPPAGYTAESLPQFGGAPDDASQGRRPAKSKRP